MGVLYEAADGVATVTLDRPERHNALDIESFHALRGALVTARDDGDVRCVVVRGAGGRAFCTGADLRRTVPDDTPFAAGWLDGLSAAVDKGAYSRLLDLSDLGLWKPMIAAIEGHCLGGGLELALQCDLRVAAEGAQFGLPEVRVGSIPGAGGVPLLLRAIPAAPAMRMLLTGERITAEEALRLGLVSDLWPTAELEARTRELARRIAGNAPLAVRTVKRLARQSRDMALTTALQATEMAWGILKNTDDRREGRIAFAEKRPPVFRGR